MSWEKTTLGEIAKCIQPGPFGSQLHSSDYSDYGVPIIMPKDMIEGKISHTNMCYVSEEHQIRLSRHQVFDGDLLVARKGDVRKCVYITENENGCLTGSDCLKVSLNKEKCHPKYIYYQLRSAYIGRWLEKISIGATMPSLNSGLLGSIELYIPPIEVQKEIADILSAYDDLIENNQKQIKLLEEAAQRLYKEWFVDLRFPGHENVKIVDGVPEGWEKKRIKELGIVITGKTPSTTEEKFYGGDIPFVKIPDMHKGIYPFKTEISLTKDGADTQKNKYIPKGSIMVSCIATVGLVNIAIKECQTNQQINSIVLNYEKDLYYVFCRMQRLKMLLEGVGSNGATMANVNKNKFSNLEIIYPTEKLRNYFFDFCEPIFKKIYKISLSNIKLQEARDRLLPKLISGDIEL